MQCFFGVVSQAPLDIFGQAACMIQIIILDHRASICSSDSQIGLHWGNGNWSPKFTRCGLALCGLGTTVNFSLHIYPGSSWIILDPNRSHEFDQLDIIGIIFLRLLQLSNLHLYWLHHLRYLRCQLRSLLSSTWDWQNCSDCPKSCRATALC